MGSTATRCEVVAANIRHLIAGRSELDSHIPMPAGISLPLGPHGGASYSVAVGVLGPEETARLKGTHLRMDRYRELLGVH